MATNENYNKEMKRLAEKLANVGEPFTYRRTYDGYQILCQDWDAICHSSSIGHENGLLEAYDGFRLKGDLTAEEVVMKFLKL